MNFDDYDGLISFLNVNESHWVFSVNSFYSHFYFSTWDTIIYTTENNSVCLEKNKNKHTLNQCSDETRIFKCHPSKFKYKQTLTRHYSFYCLHHTQESGVVEWMNEWIHPSIILTFTFNSKYLIIKFEFKYFTNFCSFFLIWYFFPLAQYVHAASSHVFVVDLAGHDEKAKSMHAACRFR